MAQAKGILPRRDDRVIKNPVAEGYFIGVTLRPETTHGEVEALLRDRVSPLVDELVARVPEDGGGPNRLEGLGAPGDRVAAVAVGFSPQFFFRDGAPRFDPPIQTPACFASLPTNVPGTAIAGDVLFYVISLSEARVYSFLSGLWAARPDVQTVALDRGYQRIDGTEPFGYADGLRNVRSQERFRVIFVHRDDDQIEEPKGAEGGSYMAYMRIVQNLDNFAQLPTEQQDQVMGRRRDGTRLDLVGQDVPPREEPSDPPPTGLPPAAHVHKVGPRGPHDDVQIFRRGLPFIETSPDGQLRAGLNFVSFQASLDQFDVVFGDWMMNPHFPLQDAGADQLLDPARAFASIEKHGFFFVPPYDERFVGATLFDEEHPGRAPTKGRIAIRKRVVDPNNTGARFERGGFQFQVIDQETSTVVAEMTTDSKGHAITDDLEIGKTYTVHELPRGDRPNVQPAADDTFVLDRRRMVRRLQNTITQPGPYGAR